MLFGFGIGINVTQAVFLGSPPPVGFGLKPFAIAGSYGTPIVCHCLLSSLFIFQTYCRSLPLLVN
jgi:hypothetical protein